MPIVQALLGLYALNDGELDRATALYERLRPELTNLPRESRWLPDDDRGR